jgi:2-polyprenyl-6-hydroxyphenyl methylase/3-demethylubiquinone-9 3-methyltransferase
MTMGEHAREVRMGERFEFGKNWRSFLNRVNEEIISRSIKGITEMLEMDDLSGLRFLDAGSGSGLSGLAARRLGAEVHSFDYDPQSVAVTRELKKRFMKDDGRWTIERGSVLDAGYLQALGEFDIVYSWGVLHHTGNMYRALENVMRPVDSDGLLFISIYNDQGPASSAWKTVKRLYNANPVAKSAVLAFCLPYLAVRQAAIGIFDNGNPLSEFIGYKRHRGMSFYHDWIDWLGGYPFEVASADQIFLFCRERGFELRNLKSSRGGCNEFVFKRQAL